MGFALTGPAPGIKGVVHNEAVLEHRVVVREIRRKSQRQSEQPGSLRCQIQPRRIGTPDDDGEGVERGIVDFINPQKS